MINKNFLKTQEQLIFLLLNHKDLINEWLESRLKKEYFDDKYQTLLMLIKDSVTKDVLLTRKSFLAFVNRIASPRERLKQELVFQKCSLSLADKNDFPLLLSDIFENYIRRKSTYAIQHFTNNIDKMGVEVSLNDLVGSLEDLNSNNLSNKKTIYEDIRSFSEEHLKYIDGVRSGEIKEPPRVLCGIPEIDETMTTGFMEGTLTLFCADTGAYKTTMMLNIGMNVWQKGYNVLFVPVEMAEKRMYIKAWSRQARIDSEKIIDPQKLSDKERERLVKAQKEWEKYESKFFILQMPRETKVSSIKRQIEKYLSIFKPKLVVIDYIDNLEVDIDRKGRHDLEISDMLQQLRRIGQNVGFAVVSGAQLGREALKRIRTASSSKNEASIHSEDIRGAHTFSMDADNVYAQVISPTQKSLMDIFVVKARYGKRIFPNGKFKATLFVTPEIGLIESEEDFDISPGEDTMLSKIFEAEETESDVVFDDVG